MDRIASPNELAIELRQLLAYAERDHPSREKIASSLAALAERIAGPLPGWREYSKAIEPLLEAISIMYPDVDKLDIRYIVDEALREARQKVYRMQQKIQYR